MGRFLSQLSDFAFCCHSESNALPGGPYSFPPRLSWRCAVLSDIVAHSPRSRPATRFAALDLLVMTLVGVTVPDGWPCCDLAVPWLGLCVGTGRISLDHVQVTQG